MMIRQQVHQKGAEMQTSEQINELIEALAKAQGEFKPAPKAATNPQLNNRYATLDNVINVIRGPLAQHNLAFVQPLINVGGEFWLETRIMHNSGQWIASSSRIPELETKRGGVSSLQKLGGAITYMRRYMLTSLLGINAEEDTDGNGNGAGHWIKDENSRKRFWAWAKQTRGLNEDEIHEALAVTSLKDYLGSKADAMTALNDYVEKQQALEAKEATDGT
jgi:hypothetical protein